MSDKETPHTEGVILENIFTSNAYNNNAVKIKYIEKYFEYKKYYLDSNIKTQQVYPMWFKISGIAVCVILAVSLLCKYIF